ncbi:MAG: YfcE family phosphodiesterase [Anaerolineae bacterium]
MKVGVISDTHIPDITPRLPEKINEIFRDVDIILHTGDITTLDTLHELENLFTITIAVAGESDSEQAKKYLEVAEPKVVEFSNRRIGMIHGHRAGQESFFRRLARLFRPPSLEDTYKYVLCQFEGKKVDCIVFGHTHVPYMKVRNGILLFNPGAVAPSPGTRPSVGILDVGERAISGKIIYL